jgi:hypothetical protein
MSRDECHADHRTRQAPGIVKLSNGETEGLEPREIPRSLLAEIGHLQVPLLKRSSGRNVWIAPIPLLRFAAVPPLTAPSGPTAWEAILSGPNAAKRKRLRPCRQGGVSVNRNGMPRRGRHDEGLASSKIRVEEDFFVVINAHAGMSIMGLPE